MTDLLELFKSFNRKRRRELTQQMDSKRKTKKFRKKRHDVPELKGPKKSPIYY